MLQKDPKVKAAMAAPATKPAVAPAAAPEKSKGPQGGYQPNLGFGFDGTTGMPFKSQAERDAGLAKQKAAKTAAPAAPAAEPGAGAMGAMASQLGGKQPNTMANTPVSKTNKAKPGNPNATPAAEPVTTPPAAEPTVPAGRKQGGGKVAGQLSQSPAAVKKRAARQAPAAEPAAAAPAATATPPAAEPAPKKGKGKKAAVQSQAEIDADRDRLMGNFTDSVHRHKQKMVAEGLANGTASLFRTK
jgi:hypothetical protein